MDRHFIRFLKQKYWFSMSSISFCALTALFSTLVYNYPFFMSIYETGVTPAHFGMVAGLTFLAFWGIYTIILYPYVGKILLGVTFLGNAVSLYFIMTYHIIIDKVMILAVLDTDKGETADLLSWKLFWYVVIWGLVPVLFIIKTKIVYAPVVRESIKRGALITCILCLIGSGALSHREALKNYMREHFSLRYVLLPSSYVYSIATAVYIAYIEKIDVVQVNENPIVTRYWEQDGKKNLFVFVMGETARDANFSLSGYHRDTNAYLRPFEKDMIVFKKTHSTWTTTRISVPCVFLHYTRHTFKERAASYTDSVLDVLNQNGYQVTWIENGSACKGLCRKIEARVTCSGRDCYDMKLVDAFADEIPAIRKDAFFVLHQRGSHGPLYYKRYPKEFEKYTPVCTHNDLKKCSYEEIVNAYDNTVHYTSFTLAELIKKLDALKDRYNPVLFFTSDHGESLGEGGHYLHGLPFKTAPDVQKEVPFFIWIPDSSLKALHLDRACLQKQTQNRVSHDYIFHSLLGLAGITVPVYDADLDLFTRCRR